MIFDENSMLKSTWDEEQKVSESSSNDKKVELETCAGKYFSGFRDFYFRS